MSTLESAIARIDSKVDESLLNQAIANSSSAIVVDMRTWRILKVTPSIEQMFGYQMVGSLRDKPLEILIPENLRETHAGHNRKYAENPTRMTMGKALAEGRTKGVTKDGHIFPVAINLYPAVIAGRDCVVAHIMNMSNMNGEHNG